MITVLLIIHLFVTLALIGVVLIQRSEGGGLGIGSSQGMGSFMSGRGTANLLTRTTAILAAMFLGLSLTLALLNRGTTPRGRRHPGAAPPAPAGSLRARRRQRPAEPARPPRRSPAEPAAPAAPTAPAGPRRPALIRAMRSVFIRRGLPPARFGFV